MRSPLSSNLIKLIGEAIDDCFEIGDGKSSNKDGIEVVAEWVDSKRAGYSAFLFCNAFNHFRKRCCKVFL